MTSEITAGTNVTATIDGSSILFTALENYNGSENFTLSVSDGEYSDSKVITVPVEAVNDAPEITSNPDTVFDIAGGDDTYSYTILAIDIDEDDLTYSLLSSTAGIEMTDNVVSWTNVSEDVFSGAFTISVTDGVVTLYQSAELEVVQYVDCADVNNGPAIEDCSGTCDGSSMEDNCGVCDDDSSNDCTQDCAGVWGGTAVIDNCDVCDNNLENDCIQDCFGVWGGIAVIDNCGAVSYTHLTLPTNREV